MGVKSVRYVVLLVLLLSALLQCQAVLNGLGRTIVGKKFYQRKRKYLGKGFPDVNTRVMVRRLWCTLQIPVLALVDADPHGIEILSVYKFGSKALSFDAHNLTVPVIKWLGVLPSDIKRLSIPEDKRIPLTDRDRSKARELLQRPYIKSQEAWVKEIETMLVMGYKAEIQALSAISLDFLSSTYLPVKVKYGKWI